MNYSIIRYHSPMKLKSLFTIFRVEEKLSDYAIKIHILYKPSKRYALDGGYDLVDY